MIFGKHNGAFESVKVMYKIPLFSSF